MEPIEVAAYALHSVFAGLWSGSVLFVTITIVPLGRESEINAAPLNAVASSLRTVSRVSAVVLLLTGSHMAASVHTGDTLTGTTSGNLVIGMVALWVVLIGTVEIGTGRLLDGTDRTKVREPARAARPIFLLASVAATLLLVVAGLLSAARLGFFTL